MADADKSAAHSETRVAAQALCTGPIEYRVTAVAGQAARFGKSHIAIRFGSILFYLEDRDALESITKAVREANVYAVRVFGPIEDAFDVAQRRTRPYQRGIDRRY